MKESIPAGILEMHEDMGDHKITAIVFYHSIHRIFAKSQVQWLRSMFMVTGYFKGPFHEHAIDSVFRRLKMEIYRALV
jgi:hypothetical protein